MSYRVYALLLILPLIPFGIYGRTYGFDTDLNLDFFTNMTSDLMNMAPDMHIIDKVSDMMQMATDWYSDVKAPDPMQMVTDWYSMVKASDPVQMVTDWYLMVKASDTMQMATDWYPMVKASDTMQMVTDWYSMVKASDPMQMVTDWYSMVKASDPVQMVTDWYSMVKASDPMQMVTDWYLIGKASDMIQMVSEWYSGIKASELVQAAPDWHLFVNTSDWYFIGKDSDPMQMFSDWNLVEIVSDLIQVVSDWYLGVKTSDLVQNVSDWNFDVNASNPMENDSNWCLNVNAFDLVQNVSNWNLDVKASNLMQNVSDWYLDIKASDLAQNDSDWCLDVNASDLVQNVSNWNLDVKASYLVQMVSDWFSNVRDSDLVQNVSDWYMDVKSSDLMQIVLDWNLIEKTSDLIQIFHWMGIASVLNLTASKLMKIVSTLNFVHLADLMRMFSDWPVMHMAPSVIPIVADWLSSIPETLLNLLAVLSPLKYTDNGQGQESYQVVWTFYNVAFLVIVGLCTLCNVLGQYQAKQTIRLQQLKEMMDIGIKELAEANKEVKEMKDSIQTLLDTQNQHHATAIKMEKASEGVYSEYKMLKERAEEYMDDAETRLTDMEGKLKQQSCFLEDLGVVSIDLMTKTKNNVEKLISDVAGCQRTCEDTLIRMQGMQAQMEMMKCSRGGNQYIMDKYSEKAPFASSQRAPLSSSQMAPLVSSQRAPLVSSQRAPLASSQLPPLVEQDDQDEEDHNSFGEPQTDIPPLSPSSIEVFTPRTKTRTEAPVPALDFSGLDSERSVNSDTEDTVPKLDLSGLDSERSCKSDTDNTIPKLDFSGLDSDRSDCGDYLDSGLKKEPSSISVISFRPISDRPTRPDFVPRLWTSDRFSDVTPRILRDPTPPPRAACVIS